MTYAFVQDVPATWERYERFAEAIGPGPAGLILHAAGPTDEGYRIIEVWETKAAWLEFRAGPLAGAAEADAALPVPPSFRDLDATHLVLGQVTGLTLPMDAAWIVERGG
jgi:hypothetical protein